MDGIQCCSAGIKELDLEKQKMEYNNHDMFDKRLKKPKVYRFSSTNEDVTVQQIQTYIVGKSSIRFNSPNIIALFINKSEKELEQAISLYNSIIKPKVNKKEAFVLDEPSTVQFYDYLEYIQTSIITLYSAIESLVNVLIPKEFKWEEVTSKGVKEIWDKSAIERWKPTSEKLTKILPMALCIKSPNTFNYWSVFKEFEVLRNSIIHVKDESLHHADNDKTIIGLLLNESVFKKIESAKNLISDLAKLLPGHDEYPIMQTVEDLVPIVKESWEDLGFRRIE
jgi:hypothetical protein